MSEKSEPVIQVAAKLTKEGFNSDKVVKVGIPFISSYRRKPVSSLLNELNKITYDEFGQRTSVEYGNGVMMSYADDPLLPGTQGAILLMSRILPTKSFARFDEGGLVRGDQLSTVPYTN